MKITVQREPFLHSLQLVSGVVGRKQTLPILSNVLFEVNQNTLKLTATDMEIELQTKVAVSADAETFSTTVPGRTLLDIIKSLPEECTVDLVFEESKVKISSNRNRFSLSSLPADDFPVLDEVSSNFECRLRQGDLSALIAKTGYAMADQDVRYYLNGLTIEFLNNRLKVVASDGHRLAKAEVDAAIQVGSPFKLIVPKKCIQELSRLLTQEDESLVLKVAEGVISIESDGFLLTSKLIDGKAPDYDKFFVKPDGVEVKLDAGELKAALTRASIVSTDSYKGVRLCFTEDCLAISANNSEKDQAEIVLDIDYSGESVEIGFNVSYLLESIAALSAQTLMVTLVGPSSSIYIEDPVDGDLQYVIMPIRL